jgi:hypothetical protein
MHGVWTPPVIHTIKVNKEDTHKCRDWHVSAAQTYSKWLSSVWKERERNPHRFITSTYVQTTLWESLQAVGQGSTRVECDGITRVNLTQTDITRTRTLFNITSTLSVVEYSSNHAMEKAAGSLWRNGAMVPLPDDVPPPPTSCETLRINLNPWSTRFQFDSEACDEIRRNAMTSSAWNGELYYYDDPFPCQWEWEKHCAFAASPNEVILLYWPEKEDRTSNECDASDMVTTSSLQKRSTGSPLTTVMTNITFRGQDLYSRCVWPGPRDILPVQPGYDVGEESDSRHCGNTGGFGPWKYINTSVLVGTWTFTSPHVYLAHHPITLENRGHTSSGNTWPAGVIQINKSDVSTVVNVPNKPTNFAQLIAEGLYQGPISFHLGPPLKTVPLNFRDLKDPVPAASYFDGRPDCFGRNGHCGTITDGSFRPSLVLKRALWSRFLPKDYPCRVLGVVDSVIAFEPVGPQRNGLENLRSRSLCLSLDPRVPLPPRSPEECHNSNGPIQPPGRC